MSRRRIAVLAISVSALLALSACKQEAGPGPTAVADPRVAIFDAIAQSEAASGRAECYLRMSGKNTSELQRLHELFLFRKLQIARSLRESKQLNPEELARLEKLRADMVIGTQGIERQVDLTAGSMSAAQLQRAKSVCQPRG
uniref:Lipoprotein n=1 Tax=uncultured bacterium Bal2-28 TaxID=139000 RepID=Q99IY7_9BACT|nr:unknown [uncultured bacterium Bal2-28]